MLAPMLLFIVRHNVQTVAHGCPYALRAGIRPGMSIAHARALLDGQECRIEPFDQPASDAALSRLAAWATRYAPLAAPDPPDGLLIDITGTRRVHRGESRLLNRVARELSRAGFHVRVAAASTFGAAWAMAHCGSQAIGRIEPGQERSALASLPIGALRIDAETVEALHEVEIDRIGQLLDLPRHDLPARFGPDLLLRLDQALGQAIETIDPVRPKPALQVQREFDGPTAQIEAIQITVRDLLAMLCTDLLRAERGVRRLVLELQRIDAPPEVQSLTLSLPCRDPRHLWALLRPKIEIMNLGFGVEAVTLTAARTATLAHEQITRWPSAASDADPARAAAELIDTLSGRLGEHRVLHTCLLESHVPELAFSMRKSPPLMAPPATAPPTTAPLPTDQAGPLVDRPTVLLPQPLRIEVESPDGQPALLRWRGTDRRLIACSRPERIVLPWWKLGRADLLSRDYFTVQDDQGRWLWIYRYNPTGWWYLHGHWA